MSLTQKIESLTFIQKIKTILYKARYYLGLVLIFIIINSLRRNGLDPKKNFNYIVNRSEKGSICENIYFDAQTYSFKSYKIILEDTLKRANELEQTGHEVIDIQVDTYVSFLSGMAKKGIRIVEETLTEKNGGGEKSSSSKKTHKTNKTKKMPVVPLNALPVQQTKKSLPFVTGAFLSLVGLLTAVENTTSIILYRSRPNQKSKSPSISCKFTRSTYQVHESIIREHLQECSVEPDDFISANFDTFKDMVFKSETTYLTVFYRTSTDPLIPQEIMIKTTNFKEAFQELCKDIIISLLERTCQSNIICNMFTTWKTVTTVKSNIKCDINYYKYTTYELIIIDASRKAIDLKKRILSIQVDTFTFQKNQDITYVAIFYVDTPLTSKNSVVNYTSNSITSSFYKYHTEIYSDLAKNNQVCKKITPPSKVSINIDSWTRLTEITNVILFYYN
jgi:hypothetical protein